jgi:hypothetical protein
MVRHRRRGLNHARRQQYLRLSRAGRLGFAGLTAGLLGMRLIGIDFALPGSLLLAVAVIVGLRARHCLPRRAEQGRRSL